MIDLAKSLLASELDAVQKQNEDFNRWLDGELMQWTKQQLKGYLHQLRALTGEAGRRRLEQAILEIQQLKAENAQLAQHVRSLELADRRAKAYQEHMDQQKQQIDHLQQELADARADLQAIREVALARRWSTVSPTCWSISANLRNMAGAPPVRRHWMCNLAGAPHGCSGD